MFRKAHIQAELSAALRDLVIFELLAAMPPASNRQFEQMAVNLALTRNRPISEVRSRFINLRVTPDAAETPYHGATKAEIEKRLEDRFGDGLADVAGFYRKEGQTQWSVNLPKKCALFGYRSADGFYDGVLCQPLSEINFFFLLSSSNFGGPKALRLTDRDRTFFERFKETAKAAA